MQPVVFVFFGTDTDPLHAEIQTRALAVLGTEFYLCVDDDESVFTRVQALKAQIMQSDTPTDLNGLHLVAVLSAHADATPEGILQNLLAIRGCFETGFATVRMVLCVVMSESPLFPQHIDKTRAFIAGLESNAPGMFNGPIFLLSDRNESNAIRPTHEAQMVEIIVRVPLLINRSPFTAGWDTKARTSQPLFFTAGITLQQPENQPAPAIAPDAVVSYLMSIPFKPVNIFRLRKLTLAQAESVLFGDALFHAYKWFCLRDDHVAVRNTALFSRQVNAWRVGTVINQLARAYAMQFRLSHGDGMFHHRTCATDITQTPPPALLLSFIRCDGIPEETVTLTQGGTARLRITGGFPTESLSLMNYTKRDYPCGVANHDL